MEIIMGKRKALQRTLIYGEPGVGKTTLASQYPNVIFMGDELPDQKDVPRLDGVEFTEKGLMDAAKYLQGTDYERVVIDTISGLSKKLEAKMLGVVNKDLVDAKKDSIHSYGKGWGNGQTVLLYKLTNFIEELEKMPKLKEIIFIAHSRVRTIELPNKQKINKIVPALETQVIEWFYRKTDNMFFVDLAKTSSQTSSNVYRNLSEKRLIYTRGTELFMAKSRFNIQPIYEFKGIKSVDALRADIDKTFEVGNDKV